MVWTVVFCIWFSKGSDNTILFYKIVVFLARATHMTVGFPSVTKGNINQRRRQQNHVFPESEFPLQHTDGVIILEGPDLIKFLLTQTSRF